MFKRSQKHKKYQHFLESVDEYTNLPEDEFVELMYTKLLGRGSDEPGKLHQLDFLKRGNSRVAMVLNFIESSEFINKILHDKIHIIPIKDEKPDQYSTGHNRVTNEQVWVFRVQETEDFDWLENKIIDNGYYERQGVWMMDIDDDKKLLAEIILEFHPQRVLDFGCANGAIMKCLKDRGVGVEGVEISRMALDKAFPEVRPHIHLGDLRTVPIQSKFDFILGLDIFEHLNPNKLDGYISRIYDLLEEQSLLFCNIPGFGTDHIFGEIHWIYLQEWDEDIKNNRLFRTLHVDDYGYPKNGHIICAGSQWWVDQFQSAGFTREQEIESALHEKYDKKITRISVSRKSFYIFSKGADNRFRKKWLSILMN